ncbi:hypothetical protein CEXT_299381 [Caerostris extrusa]|uniref:Uncharacterized protein n=1 Tax=Caerostris extrusa TaxID=172846 RepID=A0AAV4R0X6_CAEEX|nr:hypothetical protein CEXT_299381 [Caerostris extrusa]
MPQAYDEKTQAKLRQIICFESVNHLCHQKNDELCRKAITMSHSIFFAEISLPNSAKSIAVSLIAGMVFFLSPFRKFLDLQNDNVTFYTHFACLKLAIQNNVKIKKLREISLTWSQLAFCTLVSKCSHKEVHAHPLILELKYEHKDQKMRDPLSELIKKDR